MKEGIGENEIKQNGNGQKCWWEMMSATLNWSANELLMISFRADQSCRVQRVNDDKKVSKEACCCRVVTQNNEKRAGKCGVKCKMEMSGVYSRFVGCWLLVVQFLDNFSFFLSGHH